MTSKMRRTKIRIERHTITIIRQRDQRISVYCIRCQSIVPTLTPDEIAAQLNIQVSEIGNPAHRGEIHFIETSEGKLPLICGGWLNK